MLQLQLWLIISKNNLIVVDDEIIREHV
jgi:hypothetical protein